MSRLTRWLRERKSYPGRVWPRYKKRPPVVVFEADDAFHERYAGAMRATGMRDAGARRMRLYTLEQMAGRVRDVPGDVCEVGCFRGLSAYILADAFERAGRSVTIHICDSFEGLSASSAADRPAGAAAAAPHTFRSSEDEVRAHLSRFDCFRFHKGWIPAPFRAIENARFRLVHIDVDLYEPTRDAIAFLWPRLNPRGVMALDDHGSTGFPGARRAADEFFTDRDDCFFVEQVSGQALAFKLPG